MKLIAVIAIVLIVPSLLGLVYGQFSRIESHNTHAESIGSPSRDQERVDVPALVALGGMALGAGMLVVTLVNQNRNYTATKA